MADYREVFFQAGIEPEGKEEWIDALSLVHGDIEDAKASLIFISDEEDFDVEAEDVETVTDEPPSATFT